jgi:DNA-directed RNA polymerase subunit L
LQKMMEMIPLGGQVEGVLLVDHTGSDERWVTSSDLTILQGEREQVCPDVPLLILLPGQRVHVKLLSSMQTPRQHARYQMAHASHRILPVITPKSDDIEDLNLAIRVCPRNVFSATGMDPERCTYCGQCESVMDVKPTQETIFKIESNLAPAVEVLLAAMSTLRENARKMGSYLGQFLPDHEVLPDSWVLKSELTTILGQMLVYELGQCDTVTFQSIRVLHPLEPTTLLRVKTTHGRSPDEEVEQALIRVVHTLTTILYQFFGLVNARQ